MSATSTSFGPGQPGNPARRSNGRFGSGNCANPRGRPPKDPDVRDLCEARRIAARVYREAFDGRPLQERAAAIAAEIEAGARDDSPEVVSVLAGLKRGRELGRRGK